MTAVRLAGLVLLLLPAASAQAQGVRGQVRQAGDGSPVAGAFVILLDERGARTAALMTDSDGRFAIRAPVPGVFRLRVELIGYESHVSPLLTVGSDIVTYDPVLSMDAVRLPGLQVQGRRVCDRDMGGADMQRLWDEVRKVLSLTEYTQQSGAVARYVLLHYSRDYDANLAHVVREERQIRRAAGAVPYGASPALDFVERGFLGHDRGERVLLGPDAAVLLSDEFLDNYCFQLRPDPAGRLLGLGFEPQRSRRTTDIKGTLWVNAATAELDHLEFEYVRLPEELAAHGARGRTEFARLANGMWIVSRWWIRTPIVAQPRGLPRDRWGDLVTVLQGVREDGGVVISAQAGPGADLLVARGNGVVEGEVLDVARGGPLGGAVVFMLGTGQESVTDARGSFRLEGVPAGLHGISFTHPVVSMARVAIDSVAVADGMVTQHHLRTPDMTTLQRQACVGEQEEHGPRHAGLLMGSWLGAPGVKPGDVEIRADWRGRGLGGALEVDRWRIARPGDDGRFALCWLPEDRIVSISIQLPGAQRRLIQEVVLSGPDRILLLDVK
jgi:hypothetical protein